MKNVFKGNMVKLPIYFKAEVEAQKNQRLRRMSLITMSFASVLLGLAILYGLMQEGYKYMNMSPVKTQTGELAFTCNRAMTRNKIRDLGGCRCLAKAAVPQKKLQPKRLTMLKKYYSDLEKSPTKLNGKPPSPLELSRSIGLFYGHPFIREYGACSVDGFRSASAETQ